MYYDELLKLCDYKSEAIEKERQRIEKAFGILEFTPEDIETGEKRIRQYFNIELTSVRKALGLWIQCLIDLVLAKEEREKIIYCSMPPFSPLMNAMAIVSEDIYVCPVDIVLNYAVGGIFNKDGLMMEIAEGDILPAGSALCGGILAKLGAIIKGMIPVPDLLVSTGFVCDQTPKVDEFIGERYGVPVAYVDGPHDEIRKNWPIVSERRLKYLAQEAMDALTKFEKVTGHKVTHEMAIRAQERSVDLVTRFNRVFDLVRNADPIPINLLDIGIVIRTALAVNTTTIYKDTGSLVEIFFEELKERVNKGQGILPKGAPRVAIFVLWVNPDPFKIIEKAGLAMVIDMSSGLLATEPERYPSKYNDFWESSADMVYRYSGAKFAKRFKQVCMETDLDGVIFNYPIGCRDLCISTLEANHLITKELGIPVLLLEANHADSRDYSAEAMRSRVEAFAEMLKAKKSAQNR